MYVDDFTDKENTALFTLIRMFNMNKQRNPYRKDGKWCPWWHQKYCQQFEGGGPYPLHSTGEATPGGSCSGVGVPQYERSTKGHKMIEGLEHLTCAERLRELGLFSLKGRLSRILLMSINTCREGAKKMEPGSF